MRLFSKLIPILTAVTVAAFATGCSSDSNSSDPNAIGVSGSLNSVSSSAINKFEDAMTVNLATYTVSCATTTPPIATATAPVNADGTFTMTISALNQPLSCFLVDADGVKAADFLISNSANQDLNGNDELTTTATFTATAALGTINFDANAGEVTIPSTNLAGVLSTVVPDAANVFDPSGTWKIGAVDFTVPAGVKGPCAQGDNDCHGPTSGQNILVKLWHGVKTVGGADFYGLQVWDDPSYATACGNKIGLTNAVKTALGVDFSEHGADDADFTFSTSTTGFTDQADNNTVKAVTLTDFWKMDVAKTLYNIQPLCGPTNATIGGVTYSNAWKCGPDNSAHYQVQLGGGCKVTATNKNVNVMDWSGISCGGATEDGNHVFSSTCTGNASVDGNLTAVTCTNKWAVTNAGNTPQASASFQWNDLSGSEIAQGTACSALPTASEQDKMAQLRCYADYLYQSGFTEKAGLCLPRVNLDWTATTAVDFEKVDSLRPEGLVFFEKFNTSPDGNGGSMLTRQEHYEGVQVGESWVNCRVIESGGLTIRKVSATKSLAIFQSSQITTSTSKPACLGKFNGARETFMFYLTKQ